MRFIEIKKILNNNGWFDTSTKGSHVKFKKEDVEGIVIVPNHGAKDIPAGTLRSIERQSGVKLA